MSSASNGLTVLAVARVASVDTFGAATLFIAFLSAAIGFGRGAFGTPIMLAADRDHNDLRGEARFALGSTLFLGLAAGSAIVAVSIFSGVPNIGFAFALLTPVAMVVDVCRYSLISAARPNNAVFWDAVWAWGSALLFLATFYYPEELSEERIVFSSAMFATVSALGMSWQLGLSPRVRGICSWWRETWPSRIRYGIDQSMGQINVMVNRSIATALAGISVAAALGGAATLLSPLSVLLSAIPLAIIPEAVRSGATPTMVWRRLRRIGAIASLLVVTLGPALVLLPDWLGEAILGDSWSLTRNVLPIISLEFGFLVWSALAASSLQFQGKSKQLLTGQATYVVVSIVLCTSLAFMTRTAAGVAWGLVVSAAVKATVNTVNSRSARR